MSAAPLSPQVKAVLDQMRKPKPDPRFPMATEESEHARQLKGVQTVNQAPWSTLREAVNKATEPTLTPPRAPSWEYLVNTTAGVDVGNVLKRVGRVLFGAVDFFPQTVDIVHRLFSSDEATSERAETELLNLHPGAQIADRMKEAIDEWRKSKSLAAENALGDLIGYWILGRSGREVTPEMRGKLEAEGVVLPPEPKPVKVEPKPAPQTIEAKPVYADLVKQKFGSQPVIPHDQLQGLLDQFRTGQMAASKVYQPSPATPEEIQAATARMNEIKTRLRTSGAPKPPQGEPSDEWMQQAQAWVDSHQSEMEQMEKASRDLYRLNNQAVGSIRQLTDGRKVTFLTREGLRTMANARSGSYEPEYGLQGVTIGKGGVDASINMLRESQSPIGQHVADMLERGRNQDGSVTVSYIPEKGEKISDTLAVLREELSHVWQQGLSTTHEISQTLSPAQWNTLNALVPQRMKDYLHRNEYDIANPVQTVAESFAKLAGFKPSEFGMTPSEAANFLYQYLDTVVKTHGAGALDKLTHINKLARQVKEYFTHGQKAAERTADQGSARSVPEGRQAGPAQAYAQTGTRTNLSAGEKARLDELRNLRYEAHDQSEPFFLKSEVLLNEKMKGPMPASSVLAMLNGKIKPEELKWTGLQQFLAEKGNTPVTPAEIKDVLAQNDIHIKENVRGGRFMDIVHGRGVLHEKWAMPGGSDYHEMTLTIPEIEPFKHPHWPEQNVVAHVRWDTRMTPDGRKFLHLQEIQSDLHQAGRKKGYMPEGEVADAPFKKNWHELLFRRMLRYAADRGYDGVSWSSGEDQVKRFSLSANVRELEYQQKRNGTFHVTAWGNDGRFIVLGDFTPDNLSEAVGKELAEKIINGQGERPYPEADKASLKGLDLKVGGKGMRKFYDVIIPEMANDVGKPWGSRVAETKINYFDPNTRRMVADKTIQYLPVTPEMRQSVSGQKFSLFNKIINPEDKAKLDKLRGNQEIIPRDKYDQRANKEVRDYLSANGFKASGENTTNPAKDMVYTRYFEYGRHANREDPFDGDSTHTVIVYPNGEWEHTSESNHSGSGLGSLSVLHIEPEPAKKSVWPGQNILRNQKFNDRRITDLSDPVNQLRQWLGR